MLNYNNSNYFSVDMCSTKSLSATSGTFRSPGYPGNYDDELQCDVIISVTPGKTVQITFDVFDLEDHSSCEKDYVQVIYYSNQIEIMLYT